MDQPVRLLQLVDTQGSLQPGVILESRVHAIGGDGVRSTIDAILRSEEENMDLAAWALDRARDRSEVLCNEAGLLETGESDGYRLVQAVLPDEIWAVGVSYRRQALEHDLDIERTGAATARGLYERAYEAKRPEVFFKGTASRSSGPFEPLCIRDDSKQTLPEAELALVIGSNQQIAGYVTVNDMTAWDIEKESPLYLNQGKIYRGSCGVGPWLVPTSQVRDPYDLECRCRVRRDGEWIIDHVGQTAGLLRTLDELVYYLHRNNVIPPGTILCTGTSVVIPHDFALHDGDVVEVEVEHVGRLSNPIVELVEEAPNFERRL